MIATIVLISFLCALHGVRSANSPRYIADGATTLTVTSSKEQPENVKNLGIVEVFEYEEEIQNQQSKSWGNKSWQTSTESSSPPPPEVVPLDGYKWSSDWKIDITRSADGWYTYRDVRRRSGAEELLCRRRRWLRSIQPLLKVPSSKSVALKDRRFLKEIRNDYAFKGYGLSLFKSLIYRNGIGISFRVPISLNFGSLERRPYIPISSATFGVFYPLTVATFFNLSLPMELLRHALLVVMVTLSHIITSILLLAFGYNVNKLKLPRLRYSSSVYDRLGVAFSWRWSPYRGFEKRFSVWHIFLPTVDWFLSNRRKYAGSLSRFLREKFACCGLSLGSQPEIPYFSASAMFSLSGLYYKNGDFGHIARRFLVGINGNNEKARNSRGHENNNKMRDSSMTLQATRIGNNINETNDILGYDDSNIPLRPP